MREHGRTTFVVAFVAALWGTSIASICYMGQQPDPSRNYEIRWVLPYTKEIRCTCTKILFGGLNTFAPPGAEHHFYTDEPLLFINNHNANSLKELLGCDIDECELGTHDCHPRFGECKNTEGNFTCRCIGGYDGDGRSCRDIDECADGTHNCLPDLGECKNTKGNFTCSCIDGYEGDGRSCRDINECAVGTHDCHSGLGECKNTQGNFTCSCISGYEGDGRSCGDIDECAVGTHDCHSGLGECKNTLGSFTCSCIDGYDGDGRSCGDIDECEVGTHDCHPGECKNTEGNFTCNCISGRSCRACIQYQTSRVYDYQYLPEIQGNSTMFQFFIKASNDAHIALSSEAQDVKNMYEIAIGGWRNTKSVLRLCKQCGAQVTASTPNILNSEEYRAFYVSFANGNFRVGVSGEEPFMEFFHNDPFPVHYVGISTGFGSSGVWWVC